MRLKNINASLREMVEAIISKRRYLKTSEVQVKSHKKGMFAVSHDGLSVGLLIKTKDGWKGSTVAGSTQKFPGSSGKKKALEALIKKSPNGVVMPDGQHPHRYA